jgi:threonyl-tRNA synthetase
LSCCDDCCEKGDNDSKELVKNIREIGEQVIKTNKIVLYPYAHLSSNLGSPEKAIEILNEAEKLLKKDFEVIKAPLDIIKKFELKVKGHPLSELSREIKGNEIEETYDAKKLLREISKSVLDSSKLKDNDHRIIGRQMDLYSFSDVAPGMVFGTIMV